MSVYHIYKKNDKFVCSLKEPFEGKEKILDGLPKISEIFSPNVSCVVFKLPHFLKEKKWKLKFHLLGLALTSFVSLKYYSFRAPFLLAKYLEKHKDKNIFLLGEGIFSEILKFHQINPDKDIVLSGSELVNLITKNNLLFKFIPRINGNDGNIKIFIANLFSEELLSFLQRSYPLAQIEIRYLDVLSSKSRGNLRHIVNTCKSQNFKITGYQSDMCQKYGIDYQINKVNEKKLIKYRDISKLYDVCFIGGVSKSRLKSLETFISRISGTSLKIKLLLPKFEGSSIGNVKIDKNYVLYPDYLKLISESKCIIDLWRLDPHEGHSYRIAEAMALHTKVITNRQDILKEPFYDPSRFLVVKDLEGIKSDQIKEFLSIPYKGAEPFYYSLNEQ